MRSIAGPSRSAAWLRQSPGSWWRKTPTSQWRIPAQAYVSRAALKLIAALDHFGLSPDGLDCVDVGASTGGFTQVLLERGAKHVIAIDVGHAQMDHRLKDDPRITNLEGLNARELTRGDLATPAQAIVSDVSFISLKLALLPALELAEPGAWFVTLVKPQFEAGRDGVGKRGMLKDPSQGPNIAADLELWLNSLGGWQSLGVIPSPITGGRRKPRVSAGRKEIMSTETVTIHAVGAEGDGIARGPEGAIFVPFTLPGEEVAIARVKNNGMPMSWSKTSPDRVTPVCKHFGPEGKGGACGGCSLQHWADQPYQDYKRQLVIDALKTKGIETDVAPLFPCLPGRASPCDDDRAADRQGRRAGLFPGRYAPDRPG